jgi:thioredoxin reductase/bacterioferritin-associated ferredoxin
VRRESADVVVVGAGPGGIGAAVEAARAGLLVALIDENRAPGGNIYRASPTEFSPAPTRDQRRGQPLLRALDGLPVRRLMGVTVWGAFEPCVLEAAVDGEGLTIEAKAVIVAAGAYDRAVCVPGWTLPGVLTVGGAQTLLKTQRLLPGRRFLFAGTGPLLLVVAAQYAEAGAEVVAVAEAAGTAALASHASALLSAPGLIADGLRYRWTLFRRRIPWLAPAVLARVDGSGEVESATIAVPGAERTFAVDTVCIGYGLVPAVELLQLIGCSLRHDDAAGVWVPCRNEDFETTVASVFAVGDGAGIGGALAAADEGCIAGLAAARRLGAATDAQAAERKRRARRRLSRLARFRRAMDAVYRVPPVLLDRAAGDTIVCRCEDVSRRELEEAIADGARTPGQLKAWTRAGMGPCQGRMCSPNTTELLRRATGASTAQLGPPSIRPPIKPVAVEALISRSG